MATLKDYEGPVGDRIFIECVQRTMGGDPKKLVMARCFTHARCL